MSSTPSVKNKIMSRQVMTPQSWSANVMRCAWSALAGKCCGWRLFKRSVICPRRRLTFISCRHAGSLSPSSGSTQERGTYPRQICNALAKKNGLISQPVLRTHSPASLGGSWLPDVEEENALTASARYRSVA